MNSLALAQTRPFSSKISGIFNNCSNAENFSQLFINSAFSQLSPKSDQLIVIDRSKRFKEYASFLKRPIPSIHGRDHTGILTSIPIKKGTPSDISGSRKIAISLKVSSDGKSYFFDAPFGELDYADRTADYLRYKFLESISMTVGITHVKKKLKSSQTASASASTPSSLLLGDLMTTCSDVSSPSIFLRDTSNEAIQRWCENTSKITSREELYQLVKTPMASSAQTTRRFLIPQLPKTLRGPVISSTFTSTPSLHVRGRIIGFAAEASGYAVSVAGWIAYLPLSVLQKLNGVTPSEFLSKLINVHLDCFFVTSCLLDTETGTPIITLTVDHSQIAEKFNYNSTVSNDQPNDAVAV